MPTAITLDRTIDAGAVLTVLTILGGILAWCFREWRTWRQNEEQRAKDGALRLLLAILRQSDRPMTFEELRAAFSAPERKNDREAYCIKDFSFENHTEFEAAVYRLDWEGKIDFLDANMVAFSVDHYVADRPKVLPLPMPPERVIAALEAALTDAKNPQDYQYGSAASRLARLAIQVASAAASDVLRRHVGDSANDPVLEREAILLLESSANVWSPPPPSQ